MTKEIITELSLEEFKMLQNKTNKDIIIKFSAKWCKPCNKIKEYVHEEYTKCKDHLIIVELDIDTSSEIYTQLKKYKMIKGIPTILLFKNGIRENWYIPDDSVIGSDLDEISKFFNRCNNIKQ